MTSFVRRTLALMLAGAGLPAIAADWTLDPTFDDPTQNSPGRVAIPFDQALPLTDRGSALLLQPDGRYIVVGSVSFTGGATAIGMVRLLPTGALDPSFDGDGIRVKEACFSTVRGAALDTQGRIVVVGNSPCSGNATTDAGVVRFNADGSDDTTFAGDGGIAFKFSPSSDGDDSAGSVLVLADGSMLVGGGLTPNGGVLSSRIQKVNANGTLSGAALQIPGAFAAQGVAAPFNTSFWLVREIGAGSAGFVARVNNATMTLDTSFDTTGFATITAANQPPQTNCGAGVDYVATTLVRFGTTVKVFGHTLDAPYKSWYWSAREADGSVRKFGCLGDTAVEAKAAAISPDAGGSIYLGGICGSTLCLWRTVKFDATDADRLVVDAGFNGGAPSLAVFPAASGSTPASGGIAIVRDGDRSVVAGWRYWANQDFDFAVARFGGGTTGDALFANGFE